tara:strand:+ start:176 stop:631 length:456 start_codon:yes stop_codon:yes gene_type:complete
MVRWYLRPLTLPLAIAVAGAVIFLSVGAESAPPKRFPKGYLCTSGHWTVFDCYKFKREKSVPEEWEQAKALDFNRDGKPDPARVIRGFVQVEDRVHAKWYTIGKVPTGDGASHHVRFLGNITDRFGPDAPQVIVETVRDGRKSYDVFKPFL